VPEVKRWQRAADAGRYTLWRPSRLGLLLLSAFAVSEAAAPQQLAEAQAQSEDEIACAAFLEANHKAAHTNESCLKAAEAGFGPAQYSVGMGFGFAGQPELEQKYYRLAAEQRITAAYLGLGHTLVQSDPWESIYWYQRFVATGDEAKGYAAILIAKIFEALGDRGQAAYWVEVCKASEYRSCE
jgi:hypothetical protein